jgi:hypothetical protein
VPSIAHGYSPGTRRFSGDFPRSPSRPYPPPRGVGDGKSRGIIKSIPPAAFDPRVITLDGTELAYGRVRRE